MGPSRAVTGTSLLPSFTRFSIVYWAIGIALTVGLFTIHVVEWSYPGCHDTWGGLRRAAYGFPLPFWQFSGVSSFTYFFMPHILLLNVGLLAAPVCLLLTWAFRRRPVASTWIAVSGMSLLLAAALLWMLLLSMNWPIYSIAHEGSYWDYRPIWIGRSAPGDDCTPSEFWFGPVR